jgi:hypothetical protein
VGCSACFFTSCCLFSTALLTLFDVLLNMIVLHDGQARSQSSAGTPSRAVASASGVGEKKCLRVCSCPLGVPSLLPGWLCSRVLRVFFVGATVAVLSCNSTRGWIYSRVLRLRNC